MTFGSSAALFGTLIVLASVPSVSVLTVSARSAAYGFTHGIFTTLGILVGDIVYILLAIYGLSVLASALDGLFVLIKYCGGAYLIWLGIRLWKAQPRDVEVERREGASALSSFLAGLFITLADQKAVLFYLVFFPAFVDLSTLTLWDTSLIIAIATLALGGAKLSYAFLAARAESLFKNPRGRKGINIAAGIMMIAVGVFLVVKG